MKSYDPQNILQRLRAAGSPPPPPNVSRRSGDGPPEEGEAAADTAIIDAAVPPPGAGIPVPILPADYLENEVLRVIGENVELGRQPLDTRMAFFKRILHRLLRIVTGKQSNFNREAEKALRALVAHGLEQHGCLTALRDQLAEAAGAAALHGEALKRLENALQRETEASSGQAAAQARDLAETLAHLRRIEDESRQRDAQQLQRHEDAVGHLRRIEEESKERDAQQLQRHEDLVGHLRRIEEESKERDAQAARQSAEERQAERRAAEERHRSNETRMHHLLHLFQEEVARLAAQGGTQPVALPAAPAAPAPAPDTSLADDFNYLLYEDSWRGSPAFIQALQAEQAERLVPHLEALPGEKRLVLDAGCGRGEFLKVLGARGVLARGVDLNRVFVYGGREEGLDIEQADICAYLESQPDDRFGAITAFQVVEHLTPPVLRRLMELVRRKLAPGGVALFETPNPGTFAAYHWFYMDLSHVCFLAPETLRFTCEGAGLEHLETRFTHPVADHERLLETGDDQQRANIRRINEVLFGNQDYDVLVRKPLQAEGV